MSGLEDTMYEFKENDRSEAQEAEDEIEAFERRQRGEAPAKKPSANNPRAAPVQKHGAIKAGSEYVQNAVKSRARSEAQEAADEGRRDVSDLDKFEQRNGL